jgi:hypothetical protein
MMKSIDDLPRVHLQSLTMTNGAKATYGQLTEEALTMPHHRRFIIVKAAQFRDKDALKCNGLILIFRCLWMFMIVAVCMPAECKRASKTLVYSIHNSIHCAMLT